MTNSQLSLSPRALVSLIAGLTGGYPNPDDPEPVGPWGPVIRQALERVRLAALNPQPLPPRLAVARELGEALVSQVVALQALAEALPGEARGSVQSYASGLISRFIDDCGNGRIVIKIPKHGPWPPNPDEPKPIGPEELALIGAGLASAAALHPDFGAAGARLMELGLGQM